MKPASFDYAAPTSLDEALAELSEHGGDLVVLAGGQSLVPMLNLRQVTPARLMNVMEIAELQRIVAGDDVVEIGAGVRQAVAEHQVELPLLRDALAHVGNPATRNAGTVCGSVAFANPAAELPAVAVALDAEVVLRSTRGERAVAAEEFFRGPFTTAREPDELVTAVRLPRPKGRTALAEMTPRLGGAIGEAAAAGAIAVKHAGCTSLVLFGVGKVPVRAREAEALLAGQAPSAALHAEAAELAAAGLDPPSDLHMTGEHRRRLVRVLARRVLDEVNA